MGEKAESEDSGLVFPWSGQSLLAFLDWRLPFCIFLAVVVHALAFYIFRVVYPPAERTVPRSVSVSILHGNDEDARRLLNQLEDRIFFVWPGEGTQIEEWSPDQAHVEYIPSFAGHEVELRRAEPPEWKLDQNSASAADIMSLPEPDALQSEEGSGESEERAQYSIHFSPASERTYQVDEVKLRAALRSETGFLRAYVGVDERGSIRYWNELERAVGITELDAGQLAEAVRLEAAPGAGVNWLWLELHW